MDIVIAALIWTHFMGIVLGMGGGVILSIMGPRIAAADEKQALALWDLQGAVSGMSNAGLVMLLVSGPLIAWLRYGGISDLSPRFHAKMALVLILIITVVIARRSASKMRGGDKSAASVARKAGVVTSIASILIIACAVLTFDF